MYPQENGMAATAAPGALQRVTYRKEIELSIEYLEKALAKKKALLSLMDSNPTIEQFMDLNRE